MSFVCEYCSKELANAGSLHNHIKSAKYCKLNRNTKIPKNTPIKAINHVCNTCGYSSTNLSDITNHITSCVNMVKGIKLVKALNKPKKVISPEKPLIKESDKVE